MSPKMMDIPLYVVAALAIVVMFGLLFSPVRFDGNFGVLLAMVVLAASTAIIHDRRYRSQSRRGKYRRPAPRPE